MAESRTKKTTSYVVMRLETYEPSPMEAHEAWAEVGVFEAASGTAAMRLAAGPDESAVEAEYRAFPTRHDTRMMLEKTVQTHISLKPVAVAKSANGQTTPASSQRRRRRDTETTKES